MASGDASLANARAARKIVDHMNGVKGGARIPSLTPFFKKAEAEAADDELVGIERDMEWIEKRSKELYQESRNKPSDGDLPEYLNRDEFPDLIKRLSKGEYPDRVAQQVYDEIIAEHNEKALSKAIESISRENIIKDEVDKRTRAIEKELSEKSWQDRMKAMKAHMTFLHSAMLCILIPILGMLPGDWKFLQLLPLVGVVWMNWKPFVAMQKAMKDLKNERIKPQ